MPGKRDRGMQQAREMVVRDVGSEVGGDQIILEGLVGHSNEMEDSE